MASGKNIKYQILKHETGKLKTLTEPVQFKNDFSGNVNMNKLNGEHKILFAIDRLSKRQILKICRSSETKKVLNFLTRFFNLDRLPEI